MASWNNEAMIVESALRAAGWPATLADRHFLSVYPHLEFGSSKPRVLLPHVARDEARAWISEIRQTQLDPIYPCPQCGRETRRTRRLFWTALVTALGTFFPFFGRRRRCGDCRITFDPGAPEPFTAEELGYDPAARLR